MFTFAILLVAALLCSLWLFQRAAVRKWSSADSAAMEIQLDAMISSLDADERRYASEGGEFRRQQRQSERKTAPQSAVTNPQPRKPRQPKSVTPVGQAPPDELPANSKSSTTNCSSPTVLPASSREVIGQNAAHPQSISTRIYCNSSIYSIASRLKSLFLHFARAVTSFFTRKIPPPREQYAPPTTRRAA